MRPMICYFIIRPRVGKERNMERMKREEHTDTGRKRSIDRQIDGAIRAFQIFRPSARRLSFELPAEKKGRESLTEISPSFVKKKGEKNRSKNCQEHDTYEDVIIISISTRYKYLVCPYIYMYIPSKQNFYESRYQRAFLECSKNIAINRHRQGGEGISLKFLHLLSNGTNRSRRRFQFDEFRMDKTGLL